MPPYGTARALRRRDSIAWAPPVLIADTFARRVTYVDDVADFCAVTFRRFARSRLKTIAATSSTRKTTTATAAAMSRPSFCVDAGAIFAGIGSRTPVTSSLCELTPSGVQVTSVIVAGPSRYRERSSRNVDSICSGRIVRMF